MRRAERIVLAGGLVAAVVIALWGRSADSRALAWSGEPGAVRLATLDVYTLAQELLQTETYKKPIEDVSTEWTPKLEAIRDEVVQLNRRMQVLAQSDPEYANAAGAFQAKQQEFQAMQQEAQNTLETRKAEMLGGAYRAIVEQAKALSAAGGYTHVFASRPPDHELLQANVNTVLQDMLARPIVVSDAADDLTEAARAALQLK